MASFIRQLQRRTAGAAIGPSALRNQGDAGVVAAARSKLASLDLRGFARSTGATFPRLLDRATAGILDAFPPGARQSWGGARKALNLFLRDATYNKDLSDYFGLDRVRSWLELPLDKYVAQGLLREPEGRHLPRWRQIKRLTPDKNQAFQLVAASVAARKRIARVDLDIYYWRSG